MTTQLACVLAEKQSIMTEFLLPFYLRSCSVTCSKRSSEIQ